MQNIEFGYLLAKILLVRKYLTLLGPLDICDRKSFKTEIVG